MLCLYFAYSLRVGLFATIVVKIRLGFVIVEIVKALVCLAAIANLQSRLALSGHQITP
jgi:hypothetical protein